MFDDSIPERRLVVIRQSADLPYVKRIASQAILSYESCRASTANYV
jgi:hypothetical protein